MGQVNGLIYDHDGRPIGFANITLHQGRDSTFIKGAVSNEEGYFQIPEINEGLYFLRISVIGFQDYQSNRFFIDAASPDYYFNKIILNPLSTELATVEVTAQRQLYEQQLDRLIINVGNSIIATGGSVLDVLGTSPGVTVDEDRETISMNGGGQPRVAINGKIKPVPINVVMDLLKGIGSESVEKIELFAIAPARYDAEGSGGVINIIMKKNPGDGFNGRLGLGLGYGERLKQTVSLGLNYRKNQWNIYTNLAYRKPNAVRRIRYDREFTNDNITSTFINTNDRDSDVLLTNGTLGVDFDLSMKTSLGLVLNSYYRITNITAINRATGKSDGADLVRFDLNNQVKNQWSHGSINLNLAQKINDNSTLRFDLDYLKYDNDNPSTYQVETTQANGDPGLSETIEVEKSTPIEIYVAKLEEDFKLGAKASLEVGLKATLSSFFTDTKVTKTTINGTASDPMFSQAYGQDEGILAAFGSTRFPLNSKTDLQAGLRYEYTSIEVTTVSANVPPRNNYGSWFPSVFLSHRVNQQHTLSISYNRRIGRPSFNELAPFVNFLSPTALYAGNAELVPSFTNSFKLDYKFKQYLFSLQYAHSRDAIFLYQPVYDNDTEIQQFTTLNIPLVEEYNLVLSVPVTVKSWWSMQFRGTGFLQLTSIDATDFTNNRLMTSGIQLFTSQRFKLPADFNLELSGSYQTPSYYGLLKVRERGSVNLGLRKKLPGNGGQLNLSIRDIFSTNDWLSDTSIPSLNLKQSSVFDIENPVFSISYSRSFGGKDVKRARSYRGGAAAERGRVQ